MRSLVIYDSKKGCTEHCANYIGKKLNADIVQIKKQSTIDFSNYDVIIIGSPIYIGSFMRRVKNFCNTHSKELLEKKVYMYMCGTNDKKEVLEETIKRNLPVELINHAKSITFLGGEIKRDKLNFIEKLMIKMVEKQEGKIEASIKVFEMDQFIKNIQK